MVKILKITLYGFAQYLAVCRVSSTVFRTIPSTRKSLSLRKSYMAKVIQHICDQNMQTAQTSSNLCMLCLHFQTMPPLTMTFKVFRAL